MTIERFELFPLRLPLVRPFESAAGVVTQRELAVLRLTDDEGHRGLGEVTPYPGSVPGGLGDAIAALDAEARPRLEGCEIDDTATALDELGSRLPTIALAAVDTALLDLQARQIGVPLAQLFDRPARRVVRVNATIAVADAQEAAREAAACVAEGYKTIKLKVGTSDDESRVAAVREAIGWQVALRLDANGAWFSAEAADILSGLCAYGVEMVEQPVKPDDLVGMNRVRQSLLVPVVADEGVRDAIDLREHLRYAACDGVAVKISQVGGPSRAHVLVDRAEAAGLFCIVTSALDGGVGLAAGLHFACARREIELACGLATRSIFERDYAIGVPPVIDGEMALSEAPGLGVELNDEAISDLRLESF